MCCVRLAGNAGPKKLPCAYHCSTLAGYIFATKACIDNGKNLLNSNISSTCSHNMANFSPPMAEIGSLVWGILADFNGFLVLASLLQRRCSPEANQTVHDGQVFGHLLSWYTIYTFFGGWAAITLGIGPHSSLHMWNQPMCKTTSITGFFLKLVCNMACVEDCHFI